mgnify:FL=1|nr:hypothetical protein [uncultured Lachnoclostridium sp.]
MFEMELFKKIPRNIYKGIYEETFESQRLRSEDKLYSKYGISDPNSCDYHAMDFEKTEILGAFIDFYQPSANQLKRILILGYLFDMAFGRYYIDRNEV